MEAKMNVSPIRNDADMNAALAEIDQILMEDPDPSPGTRLGDKFEVLTILVEHYEKTNYPIEPIDPIDLLNFMIDQDQLKVADLVPLIGNPNRVYEVLNGKRKLSLRMIRNLHKGLNMPLESLVKQLAS
jgi:HTH-type transcriptional regulator/antitoxin HigA